MRNQEISPQIRIFRLVSLSNTACMGIPSQSADLLVSSHVTTTHCLDLTFWVPISHNITAVLINFCDYARLITQYCHLRQSCKISTNSRTSCKMKSCRWLIQIWMVFPCTSSFCCSMPVWIPLLCFPLMLQFCMVVLIECVS